MATFETTAKETEHDFLRLIQDIQAFQNDLHKEAASAVEENKHQIQELEAKIVNLKAELEKYVKIHHQEHYSQFFPPDVLDLYGVTSIKLNSRLTFSSSQDAGTQSALVWDRV